MQTKENIKSLLQSYYTQPKAWQLAVSLQEEEEFFLQCKRYSLDSNKIIHRMERKIVLGFSISEF